MGVYLEVDMSDLKDTVEMLHNALTQEQFEQLMRRTFRETGRKVKTILKTDIPHEYEARPAWIASNVGSPRTTFGGAFGVGCTIPIKGTRGVLGTRFNVAGGTGRPRKGVRKVINARIVKGKNSQLPALMKNQGGNPPFRASGIVFTRKTDKRLPIARVAGIGVPQMPLNRSKGEVQKDIVEYIEQRLEHNYSFMFGK